MYFFVPEAQEHSYVLMYKKPRSQPDIEMTIFLISGCLALCPDDPPDMFQDCVQECMALCNGRN